MPALRLDHINIRTTRVAESIAFYGDALGLAIKPPPGGQDTSTGAYAYDESGLPIIHLVGADRQADSVEPQRGVAQFGMIDHFALRCEDAEAYVERLTRHGHAFSRRDVPMIGMHLIFVRDPNGVLVELGFPLKAEQSEGEQ